MELKPNRQVLAERTEHTRATKNSRMVKSSARKTATAIEKWLERIAFWKVNTAKKRFLKQRKVRKAAHLARLEHDPKYAKRCAKRRRDWVRCCVSSCHIHAPYETPWRTGYLNQPVVPVAIG